MFGTVHYGMFVLSGVVLNLTPGSDTIYILTRSIAGGRKAGILSALGICTGIMGHTLLAAFGLSALLAKSATAFEVVKYAGVAYLVYLGIMSLIKGNGIVLAGEDKKTSSSGLFIQGVLTNLLNPKVALFFLAFLPQFVDSKAGLGALPFIFLGGTFITTATIWCLALAVFSSTATQTLRGNERISYWLNKMCGVIYIALGLKLLRLKAS